MICGRYKFLVMALAVALAAASCGESDEEPVQIIDRQQDDDLDVGEEGVENDDAEGDDQQDDRDDGEACSKDDQCASNVCLVGDDWPNGHCSTVSCEGDADCRGDDTFCLLNPQGADFCARDCDPSGSSDRCRDDYTCMQTPTQTGGWCAPDPDDSGPAPAPGGADGGADIDFDIQCENVFGQHAEFDFHVDSDADSYMVVPFSGNGGYISPLSITTPSGQVINFQGENAFQAVPAQMFGVINPTVVPAAPQFDHQFETGTHTYSLSINDSEICYYVLEAPSSPSVIDLNIYLVGVPNLDPADAPNELDMQVILSNVEDIVSQAGIQIGEINYPQVPQEAIDDYRIIRSESDVSELLRYSEPPSGGAVVSANVFITQQFSMSRGALGISLGIPGAAGLHGSGISGVAMTGEYIGQAGGGNQLTANILAHELGHFLGLFHTTEQGGQTINPLEDTPECSNMSDPTNCEDWGNLMFPSAHFDNTELTPDQQHVIEVNPLTR